jgi:hypothetical protein
MAHEERIQILTSAEESELYGPPNLSASEQRFLFSFNDMEINRIYRQQSRQTRCMFAVLLGYFKCRPIPIYPSYHAVKKDVQYIVEHVLAGSGLRPFNLDTKTISRMHQKIFELEGYQRFTSRKHHQWLYDHLLESAESWAAPRALFEAAIEHLSLSKIAIPAYSTLQKIISQVLVQHQKSLHELIASACSPGIRDMLADLLAGEQDFAMQHLRQSARNFTGTELYKELKVYHHLQPWMDDIAQVQNSLGLSQMNQQYYAERVNYYGAKLNRQSPFNQQLYLLSYLQNRYQQCLERIADGFIHHIRQVKTRAKAMAKEQVYQDWQKAARNVSKAADVLELFLDEDIAPETRFQTVQAEAFNVLNAQDLS